WLGAPSAGVAGVAGVAGAAACGQEDESPSRISPAARPRVAALRIANILFSLSACPPGTRNRTPRRPPSSMAARACDVRIVLCAARLSLGERARLANPGALAI